MATIEKSIVINASTDEIDNFALDASTWPQWFEGVQSVQTDGRFPQVGGQVETVYRSMGTNFTLTMISEELVIGSHLLFSMTGMIYGTQNWHYQVEDDAIRVFCLFDYDLPGGGLGKIADKMLFHRTNSASIEKSLANLKAIVEQ